MFTASARGVWGCCQQIGAPWAGKRFAIPDGIMRTSLEDGAEQLPDRRWGEYPENSDLPERDTFEPPQFSGEMSKNVFGTPQGAYTWDCDHVPSRGNPRRHVSSRSKRTRRLGTASVMVRPPVNHG